MAVIALTRSPGVTLDSAGSRAASGSFAGQSFTCKLAPRTRPDHLAVRRDQIHLFAQEIALVNSLSDNPRHFDALSISQGDTTACVVPNVIRAMNRAIQPVQPLCEADADSDVEQPFASPTP